MNPANSSAGQPGQKKQVVIVAMTRLLMLDFTGPADVFNYANEYMQEMGIAGGYDVLVASPTADRLVATGSGIEIRCKASAMEVSLPVDTLIIAGNDFTGAREADFAGFYQWMATINGQNARRIASVCGGAFVLARAGLLNGRKATTHWEMSEKLQAAYPQVQVNTNPFFTIDGNIYTSAGVSSGIDLALALLEEDYGREIALVVARKLVFYLARPGFQSQFGNLLPVYERSDIATRLQQWTKTHIGEPIDLNRAAEHLNMSVRNLTRVFHKQTGMSPAKFIEKLRVEAARKLLEDSDISLERIAEQCGLGGLVSMRRIFLRHLMTTPSDYRRAFRTSLRDTELDKLLYQEFTDPVSFS